MFQESELVSLVLAIPFSVPIILLAKAVRAPMGLLVAAVIAALGGAVFTVAEGIVFAGFFNTLEHICYALAGLLAGAGAWRLARWSRVTEEAPR